MSSDNTSAEVRRWPEMLVINAWDGKPIEPAKVGDKAVGWALKSRLDAEKYLFPTPPDYRNWRDRRVGWGLVLRAKPGASKEAMASDEDAPQPIRDLRAARANEDGPAPIFRYEPESAFNRTHLRNATSGKSVYLRGTRYGVGAAEMPYYLLICGTPEEIPWHLQYTLNASRAVGRLALEEEALRSYVQACLNDWADAAAVITQTVVWATAYDYMSRLMRDSVAAPIAARLAHDPDLGPGALFLDGKAAQASGVGLAQALAERRPALVVTTSHGQTGPLATPAQMTANLGLLVDQDETPLSPGALAGWEPGGAVWYAHACCSAGSDGESQFTGLVERDGMVDKTLQGVAALGSRVAPLPQVLLGAAHPVRAFIGHVEPTFDYTLRQASGQHLTGPIVQALTEGLYSWEPVGLAMRRCYASLAEITALYLQNKPQIPGNPNAKAEVLYNELTGRDIQAMVLFGDPAVGLSPPK
jgi:hypothetical protein